MVTGALPKMPRLTASPLRQTRAGSESLAQAQDKLREGRVRPAPTLDYCCTESGRLYGSQDVGLGPAQPEHFETPPQILRRPDHIGTPQNDILGKALANK